MEPEVVDITDGRTHHKDCMAKAHPLGVCMVEDPTLGTRDIAFQSGFGGFIIPKAVQEWLQDRTNREAEYRKAVAEWEDSLTITYRFRLWLGDRLDSLQWTTERWLSRLCDANDYALTHLRRFVRRGIPARPGLYLWDRYAIKVHDV